MMNCDMPLRTPETRGEYTIDSNVKLVRVARVVGKSTLNNPMP